jgi:hypothetical protein
MMATEVADAMTAMEAAEAMTAMEVAEAMTAMEGTAMMEAADAEAVEVEVPEAEGCIGGGSMHQKLWNASEEHGGRWQ